MIQSQYAYVVWVPCPTKACAALPGQRCRTRTGRTLPPHQSHSPRFLTALGDRAWAR